MENVLLAGFGEVGRHDWIAVVWRVLRWFVVDFKINFWRNIAVGFVRASEHNFALMTPLPPLFFRGAITVRRVDRAEVGLPYHFPLFSSKTLANGII